MDRHYQIDVDLDEAGENLHVRNATTPDAETAAIYRALGFNDKPGGIKKRLFQPGHDL